MTKFSLNYPRLKNQEVQREIASGELLFLLGANGTGKSSLMHLFYSENSTSAKRITAHRRVWFDSDTVNITPLMRQQTEQHTC